MEGYIVFATLCLPLKKREAFVAAEKLWQKVVEQIHLH